MQRSGTEAIRTQIKLSKPKREITNITNSQDTKRTYGQPSEQLLPNMWLLSNRNRTKNNMNTRKVKRHRNSGNKEPQSLDYSLNQVFCRTQFLFFLYNIIGNIVTKRRQDCLRQNICFKVYVGPFCRIRCRWAHLFYSCSVDSI